MKHIYLLFALALSTLGASAQIKTVKAAAPVVEKPAIQIVPYDGKSNISADNVLAHKGETLYLLYVERRDSEGYLGFYVSPGFDNSPSGSSPEGKGIYKPVNAGRITYSDAAALRERYYYVNDITVENSANPSSRICMQLVEKQTGDTLYYRAYPHALCEGFLTVRYFENLQKEFAGKKYYIRNELTTNDVNSGAELKLTSETVVICKELGIDKGKIVYMMATPAGQRFMATKGEINVDSDLDNFYTEEYMQARKNNRGPNAARSGQSNFKLEKKGRTIVY